MNDVFISYARFDSLWVEEELLQALKDLDVTFFLDDAEWRKRREDVDANGLQPGEDVSKELAAALESSRVILLVQSPAYFASKWCRWELELAEKLAAESAKSGGGLKLIYLILSRHEGRLDLSEQGERVLFVDLTNVRERAEKLSFALQRVSPKAQGLRCTLGRRSLQDLLRAPEMETKVETLTGQHREFATAHEKMQGFKEIHDTIQRAQDAWYALANVRDNLLPEGGARSQDTATDLLDKYRDILRAMESPALEDEKFFWKSQLDRSEQALAGLIDNINNLEVLNQALERTHGFLFLSTASADLNARLRSASRQMPLDGLRASMKPLRALAALPWQPGPLGEWNNLMAAFDDLERLLATIAELVTVHDSLQNIDSIFSAALRIEARLFDIENIWPEIEQESQRIRGGKPAAAKPWLRDLEKAADEVSKYLHRSPKPDAPPREEIEFFRSRLNQSFSCADTDLRNTSSRLQRSHLKLDDALDRLASPSQAAQQP